MFKWDYPERWSNVAEKLVAYFSSNEQNMWLGCLHCVHQLVKKYAYKKPEERGALNIALVRLLPLMRERCLLLINDESLPSVTLQTMVMKIFHRIIEVCSIVSLLLL